MQAGPLKARHDDKENVSNYSQNPKIDITKRHNNETFCSLSSLLEKNAPFGQLYSSDSYHGDISNSCQTTRRHTTKLQLTKDTEPEASCHETQFPSFLSNIQLTRTSTRRDNAKANMNSAHSHLLRPAIQKTNFTATTSDIRQHFPVAMRQQLTPLKSVSMTLDNGSKVLSMLSLPEALDTTEDTSSFFMTTSNASNTSSSSPQTPTSNNSTSSYQSDNNVSNHPAFMRVLQQRPLRKRTANVANFCIPTQPNAQPNDAETKTKVMRFSSPVPEQTNRVPHPTRRVLAAMGAGIKFHPRYNQLQQQHTKRLLRRVSDPSITNQAADPPFAPICPVPLPDGFQVLEAPAPCVAVPYPWCAPAYAVSPIQQFTKPVVVESRTVETQTTPPQAFGSVNPMNSEKTRRSRRSSGANQVLTSLKRTFGQIRRAISAERLQRLPSDSPVPNGQPHCLDSTEAKKFENRNEEPFFSSHNAVPNTPVLSQKTARRAVDLLRRSPVPGQSTSSVKTATVSIVPRRAPSLRGIKLRNGSVLRQRRSTSPRLQNRPTITKPLLCSSRTQPLAINNSCVKCSVLECYADGSLLVELKRTSPNGQFGFFIARDTQGIYISRLGSVKSAAALWDIMHVGDRVLQVQNVVCDARMEVTTIRNLVAGSQSLSLLIKPCNAGSTHSSHSNRQSCS